MRSYRKRFSLYLPGKNPYKLDGTIQAITYTLRNLIQEELNNEMKKINK